MRTRIAVLTVAGLAAVVQADIVEMNYSSKGRGQNFRLSAGGKVFNGFAGQLIHEVTAGTGAGADLLGFQTFYCVDILEHASKKPSEFIITALTEVPDSDPMSAEAALAMESIFAGADGLQFASDAPAAYAAAFQLAVWEIASDYDPQAGASSLDLSSGWFQAQGYGKTALSGEVLGHAASLFDAVAQGDQYSGEVFALRSERFQDQVGSRTVPAPATSLALGMPLLMLVRRRR